MDQIVKNTKIISRFVDNVRDILSLDKLLIVDTTDFKFFEADELPGSSITGTSEEVIKGLKLQGVKYNLIFEFLQFGMKPIGWKDSSNKTHMLPAEYITILESIKYVEDNGVFLTILPPSVIYSNKGRDFEQILNLMGYYFSAVFNLPDSFLKPQTIIRPILLAIRKSQTDKLFISEIDYSSDFTLLLKHYSEDSSKSIEIGIFILRSDFISFDNYKTNQQINNLQTQYKSYSEYYLEKVVDEIYTTKTNFIETENSLYIPKHGAALPISNLKDATLKHQNYLQVVLKQDIVNAQYLEVFFKSKMGVLILGTLRITFIPHVNKPDLLKIKIPIPDFETQNLIVQTSNKIKQLEEEILNFKSQISLNPNSVNEIQTVLNNALQSLGQLNEEDQILELIRHGESMTLEFKQTFSKDIKTNIKHKEKKIRQSSLKEIVAFLNSEGGTLLIGVKDSGEIFGIENDNFKDDDTYLLNFDNHINHYIGKNASPLFVDWKIVTVSNKKVLRVDCKISTNPFFLNDSDFYVRTNPSTRQLKGPDLASYLNDRFNK